MKLETLIKDIKIKSLTGNLQCDITGVNIDSPHQAGPSVCRPARHPD